MKTYTKKNGEVVNYKYNQKEYNKRFYENNKDKILNEKYMCEYCNKEVNTRNKSNHEKTVKHGLYKQIKDKQ